MQTLHQFQELFEQYLLEHQFTKPPAGLYEPVNYILGLGGKRLRPAVLMLSYYLFDNDVKKALPPAFAVEVFHNFTLLHDDIMDAAPLRRGKPTVHIAYNLNTGILSGDVMMIYAYDFLQRFGDTSKLPALFSIFTKTAIEVCEGQQMDMNFETRQDVTIEEYLKMIELKTSVLVACAMKMGALSAEADETNANHLYEFGRHLGIAFQLQDDLLDTFGDPAKFGKKAGGDIAQNKKTILYLKALELADAHQKQQLESLYKTTSIDEEKKISEVMSIFQSLKVREFTTQLMANYQQTAFTQLSLVNADAEKLALLENFAHALMKREF